MYSIQYKKAASKALRKMPLRIARRIQDEIKKIADNPDDYRGDWKKLSGSNYHRLRVGTYRAICQVVDSQILIIVLDVGPRGDIYK